MHSGLKSYTEPYSKGFTETLHTHTKSSLFNAANKTETPAPNPQKAYITN